MAIFRANAGLCQSAARLKAITELQLRFKGRENQPIFLRSSTLNTMTLCRSISKPSRGSLSGRTALVTGATSGIGLAVAEKLASLGSNIVFTDIGDKNLADKIKTDLQRNSGIHASFIGCDLGYHGEIITLCESINSLCPHGVDILVNNAGFQFVSEIESFPAEKWDQMLAVMLSAPFHLIKHFLPYMRANGWGRIINVASVHGLVASPFKSAYCSAKHGLLGLTKVVALETAGSGVTCNAICPGYVNTELFQKQVQEKARVESLTYKEAEEKFLSQYHPTKQACEVWQVADFVAFVCSDSTDQMTGSVLTMDSGFTVR